MCCHSCCEGRGQVSNQSRAQKPARNNSGWGQEGWSVILHASNSTVNLTEVTSCLSAASGNSFYQNHYSEISCVVVFAKPSVLRSLSYLVMLFWTVLISCVGRSPKSLPPPYPTLFLHLMSVQEHWFHKSRLRLKYEALVVK